MKPNCIAWKIRLESLLRTRGKTYCSLETELGEIINAKKLSGSANNFKHLASLVSSRVFLMPFASVGVIFILFRLSGFVVISHFTATYFELTGISFNPLIAPIVIGVARLASTFFLPLIIGNVTKKTAFTTLGFSSTLGMLTGKFFKCIIAVI